MKLLSIFYFGFFLLATTSPVFSSDKLQNSAQRLSSIQPAQNRSAWSRMLSWFTPQTNLSNPSTASAPTLCANCYANIGSTIPHAVHDTTPVVQASLERAYTQSEINDYVQKLKHKAEEQVQNIKTSIQKEANEQVKKIKINIQNEEQQKQTPRIFIGFMLGVGAGVGAGIVTTLMIQAMSKKK